MPADLLLPLFALTLIANAALVAAAVRGMRRGPADPRPPLPVARSTPGAAPAGSRANTDRTAPVAEHSAAMTDDLARAVDRRRAILGPEHGRSNDDSAPAAARPAGTRASETGTSSSAAASVAAATADPPAPKRRRRPAAPDEATAVGEPDLRRATGSSGRPEPVSATRTPGTEESRASDGAGNDRPKRAARTPATPRPEPRRGRRRFSLPPLDEDHEKVNRSIESFLGGIDGSGPGPDPGSPAAATSVTAGEPATSPAAPIAPDVPATRPAAPTGGEPAAGPVTVALVAIEGLPDGDSGDAGPAAGAAPGHPLDDAMTLGDPVAEALTMVERTLRGAARGTDVVTTGERGRFRVVLPSTGELAARAYLRRVRATIEPHLEATRHPLRLTVATATALDEPVEEAVRRAEHRLASALDVRPASDAASGPVPPGPGATSAERGPGRSGAASADGTGRPAGRPGGRARPA